MTAEAPRPAVSGRGNGLLLAVGALLACGASLLAAGYADAWMTGARRPGTGLAGALRVLVEPGRPGTALGSAGLNPVLYWLIAAVLLAACAAATVLAWRVLRSPLNKPRDVHRADGLAAGGEIARAASVRHLIRQAAIVRPSLECPRPEQVGYLLGHASGRELWCTVEDSLLLIGPPRSGKGTNIVINSVLDAPGAVVTTSTRTDTLALTLKSRERTGPVAVFDPQGLAPRLGESIRWSPVRGCQDPTVAMIRAAGLAAAFKYGDVENGGFWQGKTRTTIQCLLHAAALDHRGAAELYRWAVNPASAADAVRTLAAHPDAAPGWAETLESTLQADPRTRDSVWHGVGLAFDPLADPRVLEAVSPTEDADSLDPARFLDDNGTIYLLATGSDARTSAPLVAALIEDIVEVARHKAAHSPGARLDPPLLMALDEIGNLSPLPSLPTLMAEGGGTGITMLPVLQSMAQARAAWGEQKASAIWDAAIVKILLGGGSLPRELGDISQLLGQKDELVTSTSWDAAGQQTTQQSLRRVPVLATEEIRTLPAGTGLVLLRTARPIIADLRPWTARTDAAQLRADQADYETAAGIPPTETGTR